MTPNESIAFTHATILDGTANMAPQQDMTVVVGRGVIARVGKASRVDVPAGARVVDLGGARAPSSSLRAV